jgi:uncharacterized protein (TIGR02284 family)
METIVKLIKVHKTRKKAYEKAIRETKDGDEDLRHIFLRMVEVSHIYSQELSKYVNPTHITFKDTTYRRGMHIKALTSNSNRFTLLNMCKWGEDMAQNAYNEALEVSGYSTKIEYILYKQREVLKTAHNLIKDLLSKEGKRESYIPGILN